ncbi:MAG TPA: hypothetical protein DDZ81_15120 [Acetobacteraceae bacterium]|jgi:hypothetical protein|nr:hypothetical protein [Acetobacteraceae bacterium]
MSTHSMKPPPPDKRLQVIESCSSDRISKEDVVTAEIGRQIIFDARVLDTFDVKGCQPFHYDLLVVCAAVEFADRHWKRPQSWSRTLHVTVPVIDIDLWQKPNVLKSLRSVLQHLTGDTWKFTFVRAKNLSPIGLRQIPLDFAKTKTFAVAYSDGLDSRAVSALSGDKDEVLCVRVANKRQRRKKGETYFFQIPFKVDCYRSNESSFRSRGFKFAAVAATAAQLSGVKCIIVPESGQGALGPVLLPLHRIYPDYRNHPTFFRKMEQFVGAANGYQAWFEQPRLWFTKGQTLRAFLDLPGKTAVGLTNTRSCWQTRRVVNKNGRKQCGICAACLLRRLSLHAVNILEAPDTYVVSDLTAPDVNEALKVISGRSDRDIMVEYGSVGVRHFEHLADMASRPDDYLRVHASEIASAIGERYEDALGNLRSLLLRHTEEWRAFLSAQGEESFLRSWMDGGRHGRFE